MKSHLRLFSSFSLITLTFLSSVTANADVCLHPSTGLANLKEIKLKMLKCLEKKGIAIVKGSECFKCYSDDELKASALEIPDECQVKKSPTEDFQGSRERASVYVYRDTNARAVRAPRAVAATITSENRKALDQYCKSSENTFLTVTARNPKTNCHNIGFRDSQPNTLLIGAAADACIAHANSSKSESSAHEGSEKFKDLPDRGARAPNPNNPSPSNGNRATQPN